MCTFEGKGGFGCNPKYVVQKMHEKNPGIEFIWLVNPNAMHKHFPKYIKKVENTPWKRAYYLSRAKVWIDNYRKPYGTVKRAGQYYLNTNHYTLGIKTVGLWRGKGFSKMAYLVSKNDSDMIDNLIIDSKFGEIMSPKGLVYDGTYLKTGAPRCDVLYGDRTEKKNAYRKRKKLPQDAKILMFAPTFREGAKNGKRFVYSEEWTIDFKRLIEHLEAKFGGKWYICFRVHPQLAPGFKDYKNSDIADRIINESQADDLYEILAAMDAYITDYSSACFEAGFAKMPVFIYADDIKKYEHDRGSLFWDMAKNPRDEVRANQKILRGLDVTFPYTIATNQEELEVDIDAFDLESYEKRVDEFHKDLGLVFTGHASEDVAEYVMGKMV
ncbi:MAG: CDP-glycerol glycerophosphotransferase family protein [Lachnospiraceae bacterium]|nr:CDP-glycerol glycerophosphotransferase family protein [Lachnospiraceae bacterium]